MKTTATPQAVIDTLAQRCAIDAADNAGICKRDSDGEYLVQVADPLPGDYEALEGKVFDPTPQEREDFRTAYRDALRDLLDEREEYSVVVHGVEHSQYFQGCGTAFTPFENCFTGIGEDAGEAFDDALEQAATSGHDVEFLEGARPDPKAYTTVKEVLDDCGEVEEDWPDIYFYVSVLF